MKHPSNYIFSQEGKKDFKKLPFEIKKSVVQKLDFWISSGESLFFAKRLINSNAGEYRFRVREYRICCDVIGENLVVRRVGHRKEIYK
jgi:mRNA interferase RelE/StbE